MSKIDTAWERTKNKDFLRIPRQLNHPIRKLIVENTVGESVLDVGCASAIQYPLYEDMGIKYTGLDFTKKFLDHATELYGEIDLIHADASNIPLPDRGKSTVFCKDLLEHLPPDKWKEVLSEMWRVTDKRMMVAFYIAPWEYETIYKVVKSLHYKNVYSFKEIYDFMLNLDGCSEITVKRKLGFNNSDIWIIDKNE